MLGMDRRVGRIFFRGEMSVFVKPSPSAPANVPFPVARSGNVLRSHFSTRPRLDKPPSLGSRRPAIAASGIRAVSRYTTSKMTPSFKKTQPFKCPEFTRLYDLKSTV